MTTTNDTKTLVIPAGAVARFEAKVAKFAAKLAKKGLPGPAIISIGAQRVLSVTRDDGSVTKHLVRDAVLSCPVAKLPGGYKFVASAVAVETDDGERHAVVSVADADDKIEVTADERARCATLHCEHCRMNRKRNRVFLLRSAEHGSKVVGSTCVSEFLGVDTVKELYAYDAYTAFMREIADDANGFLEGEGRRAAQEESLVRFLAAVIASGRNAPFVSGREAYEIGGMATGRMVLRALDVGRVEFHTPGEDDGTEMRA
jgi:hypothetical protein